MTPIVRLCLLFAVLLMASCLTLVTKRFESRQLFITLGRLQDQAQELDVDWRRLQLERSREARHARIDHIARQTLKMTPRTPDRVLYVTPGAQP